MEQGFWAKFSCKNSNDYNFKYASNGTKIFYEKGGRRVSKKDIPTEWLEHIKESDSILTISQLIHTKTGLLIEIERLQRKIEEIDAKLVDKNIPDAKTAERYIQNESNARKKRTEEIKGERKRKTEEFFKSKFGKKDDPYKKFFENYKEEKVTISQESILKKFNITTKKEWRVWLLKNHPDKNSNTNLDDCQNVIHSGRNMGW